MGDRFLLIGDGLRSLMALSTAEIIRDITSWNRESTGLRSMENLYQKIWILLLDRASIIFESYLNRDSRKNLYSLMICVYVSCRIKYRKFNIWKMIISQKLLFRANKIRWRRRGREERRVGSTKFNCCETDLHPATLHPL